MTTITDDEREAREWLLEAGVIDDFEGRNQDDRHRATILARLDAPRMPRPEDVTETDLLKMLSAHYKRQNEPGRHYESMRAAYAALYDHFTAPPKKVEAWGVKIGEHGPIQWAYCTRADAERLLQSEKEYAARPRDLRIVRLVEDGDGE